MALLLQTGCNSIRRDRHIFLFTKMSRTVPRLPQTFNWGIKWLVYKTDDTFIVPKLKTPGTVPPSPVYFHDWKRSNLQSLPTPQSPCKYTKEASVLMDVFRNRSISTKQSSRSTFACTSSCGFFPANRPLVLMPISGQSHSRFPHFC